MSRKVHDIQTQTHEKCDAKDDNEEVIQARASKLFLAFLVVSRLFGHGRHTDNALLGQSTVRKATTCTFRAVQEERRTSRLDARRQI